MGSRESCADTPAGPLLITAEEIFFDEGSIGRRLALTGAAGRKGRALWSKGSGQRVVLRGRCSLRRAASPCRLKVGAGGAACLAARLSKVGPLSGPETAQTHLDVKPSEFSAQTGRLQRASVTRIKAHAPAGCLTEGLLSVFAEAECSRHKHRKAAQPAQRSTL